MAFDRSLGSDFWAVALKDTDQLVGHLYFAQTMPKELLTWELGYIFNPAFQGQGFATESSTALIRYGFEHWDIHRVVAHCNPENIASWRVMEKIGMQREGYFRQNIFFKRDASGNPIWLDTYEYAILKEDWLTYEHARRLQLQPPGKIHFLNVTPKSLADHQGEKDPGRAYFISFTINIIAIHQSVAAQRRAG